MIPGTIKSFVHDEATVAVAGTRDADNNPRVHKISGWAVEEDDRTIRCLVPAAYTDGLIAALEDNGQFALTMEQLGSHKTYQFKGEYIDSRAAEDRDFEMAEEKRQQLGTRINELFGLPAELGWAFMLPPEIVVRFAVGEIFLQTPGPGAGQRLVPKEEE